LFFVYIQYWIEYNEIIVNVSLERERKRCCYEEAAAAGPCQVNAITNLYEYIYNRGGFC
jgi:hypothetical protein